MAARISVAAGSTFDLLFPPQCALCQAEIDPPDDPVLLCEECRSQILPGAASAVRTAAAALRSPFQPASAAAIAAKAGSTSRTR